MNDCFCNTHPFTSFFIIVGLVGFVVFCFFVPGGIKKYLRALREEKMNKQKSKEKEVIDQATKGFSYRKSSSKDIELAGEDFVRRSKEAASKLKLSDEAAAILKDAPEVSGASFHKGSSTKK